jgi:hypothetical protein
MNDLHYTGWLRRRDRHDRPSETDPSRFRQAPGGSRCLADFTPETDLTEGDDLLGDRYTGHR